MAKSNKLWQRQKAKISSGESGFSILELSVILAIVSFAVVNAIIVRETRKDFTKVSNTYEKLEAIKEYMGRYAMEFGRYPCPADGRADHLGAELGRGQGTEDADVPLNPPGTSTAKGHCATNDPAKDPGTPDLGIFRVDNADYDNFGDMVAGVVPTRDLGLPSSFMSDEWGNRITYAVMEHMTSKDTFPQRNKGDITITSDTGTITSTAAYVLISHGPNGMGAWPFEGGSSAVQNPSPTNPPLYPLGENENHHLDPDELWDMEFFKATKPPADPDSSLIVYDDIVIWSEKDDIYANTAKWPFEPWHLPGLVLWLDAWDKNNTAAPSEDFMELSGVDVDIWKDRSFEINNTEPNNAVGSSGATWVQYEDDMGGRPAMEFNATSTDALEITADSSSSSSGGREEVNVDNLTLFVVGHSDDTIPDNKTFVVNAASPPPVGGPGWGFTSTAANNAVRGFWVDSASTPSQQATSTQIATDYGVDSVFVSSYDQDLFLLGSLNYYKECSLLDSKTYFTDTLAEDSAVRNMYIGAYDASGNGSIEGALREVVLYKRPLTTYDRERITKYLADKWGIASACAPVAPTCAAGEELGSACADGSTCCSNSCNANVCCIADGYGATPEKCTDDSDCCVPGSKCTDFGYCWTPPPTP